MQEAVLTTKDFMNISITVSIIVISILIAIALVHAILIMRDVRKVSKITGDITEGVNSIITAPLALIAQVSSAIAPQAEKTIKSWLKKGEK
jgi:acid phosphatase family membrane protein YuiD